MEYKYGQSVKIESFHGRKLENAMILDVFSHWTGVKYWQVLCNDGGRMLISELELNKLNAE